MRLKAVEQLVSVLSNAERFRRTPTKDIGSCVIGDGIYMKVGSQELCVVSARCYQGSVSKKFEIIGMLPYLQKNMPEYDFYYLQGWLD